MKTDKTIMMIHGMWGGAWYWKNFKNFFETKGYSCITPTLSFHNVDPNTKPDPRLGNLSLLDYAKELEEKIKQLNSPPILFGHSMGGLLVQILGSRGLAKALVLLAPTPPFGILPMRISNIMSIYSVRVGLTWHWHEKPQRPTLKEAIYLMLHLLPADEQREIYDKLVYESGRAAFEIGLWLFDSKKAAKVDESKVVCPVLTIAGKEDRLTPASVIRKIADKYKTVSNYKEFTHHAHWLMGEPGWQDIAECINGWLNEVLDYSP